MKKPKVFHFWRWVLIFVSEDKSKVDELEVEESNINKPALINLEKVEKSDDMDDQFSIHSVMFDVASVVRQTSDNIHVSPTLERRKKTLKQKPFVSTHKELCGCRMCSNLFLRSNHCQLALFYSEYLKVSYGFEILIEFWS